MNLLEIEGLRVTFRRAGRIRGLDSAVLTVVDGVDLSVEAGQTVGLVGASGAGKTTVAKAVLHLVQPQSGRITVDGFDVTGFGRDVPLGFRKDVQMVFQNPTSSLNPMLTVADLVGEPLRLHFGLGGDDIRTRIAQLLRTVGLPTAVEPQRPHRLSVGQRQRVAIARALATEPRLVVLDEPFTALDAGTRRRIMALLEDDQRRTGVAYLLITHDIAVARRLCHSIAVMHGGRIVEQGPVDRVWKRPQHPYTQLLLASVLEPDPESHAAARARRQVLESAR